jgi:O-antigen/teichoic acid export membrane protein
VKFLNLSKIIPDFALKSILLILGRVLAMGLSFLITMLTARFIGGDEYGKYTFLFAIVNWVSLIFTLGLDSVPKMLAAVDTIENQRKLLGGFFVFSCFMNFLLVLVLLIISAFIDTVFHVTVGANLFWLAPFAGANLFQILIEWACFGLRKPAILSAILILSRLTNLLFVIIFMGMGVKSAELYYFAFLLSGWVFFGSGWLFLRPSFDDLKKNLNYIKLDFNVFGRDTYIGRVPAVLANGIDRILLGYFVSNRQLGFYGLSQSLSNPIVFVGSAVSQVAYRDFSNSKKISLRMFVSTFLVSLLAYIVTCGLGLICVRFFLSPEFHGMTPMIFLLSLSAFFQSLYAPFNSFLGAKGQGKMLRSLGWTYTLSSLFLFTIAIPLWGEIGAASASVLINIIWFLQCVRKYNQIKINVFEE